MTKHTFTVPEILELADRMIGRGTASNLAGDVTVQEDCLAVGRILAHFLLSNKMKETIKLNGGGSPPTAPE